MNKRSRRLILNPKGHNTVRLKPGTAVQGRCSMYRTIINIDISWAEEDPRVTKVDKHADR